MGEKLPGEGESQIVNIIDLGSFKNLVASYNVGFLNLKQSSKSWQPLNRVDFFLILELIKFSSKSNQIIVIVSWVTK